MVCAIKRNEEITVFFRVCYALLPARMGWDAASSVMSEKLSLVRVK